MNADNNYANQTGNAKRNDNVAEPLRQRLFSMEDSVNLGHGRCEDTIAVLVCHGMGQQLPFDTLRDTADAIVAGYGQNPRPTATVRMVQVDIAGATQMMPRLELALVDGPSGKTVLHLYEAYWAPLTEGMINYRQTARFLWVSGWLGFLSRNHFKRWKFGAWQTCTNPPWMNLLFGALVVGLGPLLALALSWVWIVPLAEHFLRMPPVWSAVFVAALAGAGWALWKFRKFILQYLGDVAIYVTSNTLNQFWKVRAEIKRACLDAATVVYTACTDNSEKFLYKNVIVVGHSLGSVVAYDTLNTMINQDRANGGGWHVSKRTAAFVTIGSPLDKTAFLFQIHASKGDVRDVLAGAIQPMIQDYMYRPRSWINIHASHDIIASSLHFYDNDPRDDGEDDPTVSHGGSQRITNVLEKGPWWPVSAHTGYWKRDAFIKALRGAIGLCRRNVNHT